MEYDYTDFEIEYNLTDAHDKFENAGYYFKDPEQKLIAYHWFLTGILYSRDGENEL